MFVSITNEAWQRKIDAMTDAEREAHYDQMFPWTARRRRARKRREQRRAYMAQNSLWLAEYEQRMRAAYDRWWRMRTGRNRRTEGK